MAAAPINNEFWKLRSKHGRDKLFKTPQLLWQAACEYFQWIESNPLYEAKAFAYQGDTTITKLPKMRAMTLSGLCFYLRCNEGYFRTFKAQLPDNEEDFNTVISEIEAVIFRQKFEGAAADLLNANIISRDLGLMDKQSVDLTTDLTNLSEEQLITIGNQIVKKSRENGNAKQ